MKTPKWKKEKEIYEGNKSIVYTIDLDKTKQSTQLAIFLDEKPNQNDAKKTKTSVEIVLWVYENSDATTLFKKNLLGNIEIIDKQYNAGLKTKALELTATKFLDIANTIINLI